MAVINTMDCIPEMKKNINIIGTDLKIGKFICFPKLHSTNY